MESGVRTKYDKLKTGLSTENLWITSIVDDCHCC